MFNRWKKYFTDEQSDTEIICLLDRSSSMQLVKNDAINGFNNFIADQKEFHKKLGKSAALTLILFDRNWEIAFNHINLKNAPKLSKSNYVLGYGTALYDAIARSVAHTLKRMEEITEEKRPKVIMMILTDGLDSMSKKFDNEDVAELVRETTQVKAWEFFFMTTSPEAYEMSETMGFLPENTHLFTADADGMSQSFTSMSQIIKEQLKELKDKQQNDPESENNSDADPEES